MNEHQEQQLDEHHQQNSHEPSLDLLRLARLDVEPTPIRPGASIDVVKDPSYFIYNEDAGISASYPHQRPSTPTTQPKLLLRQTSRSSVSSLTEMQTVRSHDSSPSFSEYIPSDMAAGKRMGRKTETFHHPPALNDSFMVAPSSSSSTAASQALIASHQLHHYLAQTPQQNNDATTASTYFTASIPAHTSLVFQQQQGFPTAKLPYNQYNQKQKEVSPSLLPPGARQGQNQEQDKIMLGGTTVAAATIGTTTPATHQPRLACPKPTKKKRKKEATAFLDPEDRPRDNDVVCCRGRRFYKAPGSIRFRSIRDDFIQEYITAATKEEKSVVIDRVIEAVRSDTEARFLRYHGRSGTFSFMSLYDIRDKVGHALRTAVNDTEDPQNHISSSDDDSTKVTMS